MTKEKFNESKEKIINIHKQDSMASTLKNFFENADDFLRNNQGLIFELAKDMFYEIYKEKLDINITEINKNKREVIFLVNGSIIAGIIFRRAVSDELKELCTIPPIKM